ncbi:hypothetical protein D3C72_1810140 [compost metagenome]
MRSGAQVWQVTPGKAQSQQTDRQVHIKDGAPAVPLRNQAAQGGPYSVGNTERSGHDDLPAQTHMGIRKQFRNAGKRGPNQHTAPDTLQAAGSDQERHVRCHAA